MFKSRMHSVAMLLAVALTASVSVSAATAPESQPTTAPAPTYEPIKPTDSGEVYMESDDAFICPPEDSAETDGELQHRPTRPPCR